MDWAQVFVICLAIVMVVFIVVAIILAISLFRVTRQLKAAAVRVERTFEDSAKSFQRSAVPLVAIKGILEHMKKRSEKDNQNSRNEPQ